MVEKGHRPYGTEPEDLEAEAALQEATEAEREADQLLAACAITRAEYTERLSDAARLRRTAGRSADEGLRFESLRSDLFAEKAVRLIADDQVENPAYDPAVPESKRGPYLDTRLRNETLHKVLRRLMLTKGKGKERGGFISYAQLGINQLGAVYEGLMSYTGFIAVEDLYEVAKGGDASGGSWMIPESKVHEYEDDVFVRRVRDETTGHLERVVHPEGSFVYRLAGRDRQTSASYYTPKSLTEVTVELALKHRLDQDGTTTPARELLEWKICEPALGSGAFLNEAIDQVASEYLRRREGELGRRIDTERRQIELQKTKAYVALHNAYGVDLNATAVELAEVSLWLNTMHPGMRAPWFGLHLRRGNSLIGAGRKVYRGKDLHKGAWLARKDALSPDELPFRDGDLPEGAVHHFLLPAVGWGAVAAEPEAKKLAPDQASALAAWRKGIQKSPKGTAFAEREDEPAADRAKRYATWQKRNRDSEAGRLQRLARTTEFLWRMVAKRLELSEDKIARRIDVWGADWLDQPDQAIDRQRVLDDLTATGTPYWRLKKVMDAWCALWFWPLDKVAELDGTARAYEVGGGVVSEADLAALLGGAPAARTAEPAAPEPTDGPAPGDQGWEKVSLFGEPVEEEQKQQRPSGQRRGGSRQSRIPTNRWRDTIPLKTLADWLDFLDCLLGTHEVPEGSFLDAIEDLDVLTTYEKDLVAVLGMDEAQHLTGRFPWLGVVESIAGSTEKDIQAEDGHGFFHWELHFAHVFRGKGGGSTSRWGTRLGCGRSGWRTLSWLSVTLGSC